MPDRACRTRPLNVIVLRLFIASAVLSCLAASAQPADDPDDIYVAGLERVFGKNVHLDSAMIAKVLKDKHGKRHYVDANQDGSPEEVWFIDTDQRHLDTQRPLLVRVIDEDGDLKFGDEPDLDSDLYIADWQANGTIDRLCDHSDTDLDGDLDEMGLYSATRSSKWEKRGMPRDSVRVWCAVDVNDDNLLWFDVGYTYSQATCQYRTHFGGGEYFCFFSLGPDDSEWQPAFEDPFIFYDNDNDRVTEEAIRLDWRITGDGGEVKNLRHSFDADDDGTEESPRDYDVSITAFPLPAMSLPENKQQHLTLRNIPTAPFIAYEGAPEHLQQAPWDDAMLTWDENDLNIHFYTAYKDDDAYESAAAGLHQEKWEGVISTMNDYFPKMGAPASGPFNKRYEVRNSPGIIQLYFTAADQRLHLYGARHMWMIIDSDYDGQPDARYDYLDTDGNGFIDTWTFDADGDGNADDTWKADDSALSRVPYAWSTINAIAQPTIERTPRELFVFIQRLRASIRKSGGSADDELLRSLNAGFDNPTFTQEMRVRLFESNESLRFYLDVVKDNLIIKLKSAFSNAAFWKRFGELRARGDFTALARLLETEFQLKARLQPFARWQAEQMNKSLRPRVGWGKWDSNIGWESDKIGYRCYDGHFDFFGKKDYGPRVSNLFSPSEADDHNIVIPAIAREHSSLRQEGGSPTNYHREQSWGLDALHVGDSPGCGSLTLYTNNEAYPIRNPDGNGDIRWNSRLVSQTANEIAVEITADNVGPKKNPYSVRYLCSIKAGRKRSNVKVLIEDKERSRGDKLELGIGIVKLRQESFHADPSAGVLGAWGVQDPEIGYVGIGVIYPKEKFVRFSDASHRQHEVILEAILGIECEYHIQCDWLRGRRFPVGFGATDWMQELRRSADRLNAQPQAKK